MAASTSSDTTTGTAAMTLGAGRPAAAAASEMVGTMKSSMRARTRQVGQRAVGQFAGHP